MYVYIYDYIHVYVCMHTHIYIHIYTASSSSPSRGHSTSKQRGGELRKSQDLNFMIEGLGLSSERGPSKFPSGDNREVIEMNEESVCFIFV
jgi:hypothetical protein